MQDSRGTGLPATDGTLSHGQLLAAVTHCVVLEPLRGTCQGQASRPTNTADPAALYMGGVGEERPPVIDLPSRLRPAI